MGIDPKVKKFLKTLFPECFSAEIDCKFNVTIMDITQNLAAIVNSLEGKGITVHQMMTSIKSEIYRILANKTTIGENVNDVLVLLLDNPFHVPGNKSFLQKQRDNNAKNKTFMNENEYIKFKELNKCKNNILFPDSQSNININGKCLWRDINFRNRLNHLVSRELLGLNLKGYEEKKIIIDDGLFLTLKDYSNKAWDILLEYDMDSELISEYQRDTLISLEMQKYYQTAMLYMDKDGKHCVVYKKSLEIGESDCKAFSYIKRDENNNKYLLITQDSDNLFYALLHCKSLLHPETFKFNNQLYIDCLSRGDKSNNNERDYRYINITKLYQSIINFFETEFNGVNNPIEVFVFIFLSYYSDYHTPVSKELNAGPVRLWKTFASLHSTHIDGYIPFCTDRITKRVPPVSSLIETKFILNNAITIEPFNRTSHIDEFGSFSTKKNLGFFSTYFVIRFDTEKIKKFYCYLYQQNIAKHVNLKEIIYDYNLLIEHVINFKKTSNNKKPLKSQAIPSKKNVEKAIELINKKQEILNNKPNVKQDLTDVRKKHNNSRNEYEVINLINSIDNNNNGYIDDKNADLNGLLTLTQLHNRINMINWIMNYFQNGWKSNDFSQSYYLQNKKTSKSLHGWKLTPCNNNDADDFPISSNYIIKIFNINYKASPKCTIYSIYNLYKVEYTDTVDKCIESKDPFVVI